MLFLLLHSTIRKKQTSVSLYCHSVEFRERVVMTRSSKAGVTTSSKRLSVFDFSEDDGRIETASKKLINRFRNRNDDNNNNNKNNYVKRKRHSFFSSSIDKYKFLECFAGWNKAPESESRNEPIDVDDEPIDVDTDRGMTADCEEIGVGLVDIDANSAAHCHKLTVSSPISMIQEDSAVKEISGLDVHVLSSSSKYENVPRGMISDDGDKSGMSSSSTSICMLEENEVPSTEPETEYCSLGHKIDILNNAVVVFPDFILYGDINGTESCLTFSSSHIRVEGLTINGSKGSFNAEWAIADIVSIESEWCGRVETAMIKLHLKPNVSESVGNSNESSGIDELKVSVYDPCWSEGQEAIKSLDVRYRDIWNVIIDSDQEKDDKAFAESYSVAFPKPFLHVLDETFEDVIYPEGDPDAVSISKRDVELLRPETFINDTIIDFYIKFLKNKIQPEDQHRYHFFNSFFFRKLADLDKDPSGACEGRAAFQRVRKWTKKVNLFEKDFIFIPVNYSLHWSLIVICHPGEVAHFRDEECEIAPKVPCILHMDSIRGSHRGLKNLIQSYLCEEWKERHSEILDDASSKFSCLRFVPLELPQQENSFDCGLFLLHYVELFLEGVPINFSPFKITESSNFLNRNWFPPLEASLKRSRIKKLICEILEARSQKAPQGESNAKNTCSQFFDTDEQGTGKEYLEKTCSLVKMYQGDSSSPNTDLRISLPSVYCQRVVQQQIKEPGLHTRELFEPGTSVRASGDNYLEMEACRPGYMSPIQEVEESVERISDSSSDPEYHCQYDTSYFRKDFKSFETSWEHNGSLMELYDADTDDDWSSGISSSDSQKSSEIGVDENHLHQESSTPFEDLETCVVEDSEEADWTHKGNDSTPNNGEFGSVDKIVRKHDVPVGNDNLMSESDEQAAKSPKFISPEG
ncbi:probable ubiquitin-like-specific protease 2A isoform X3 [Ricinus communis]|uniref:probable ubiquitin-like-specific protease 2A isoform X3 n=1 Tax=Ricinus communis TaxID=3988 RepID=UPI00201A24DF|nr:probable ubiquitin-like-specific protease 2A isoform X3 [Ricinus communis]